ncbi:hypothetical protein Pmani_027629 [Petrolisthes manimaculis]|uniref:Uncharacterized protein n=1 Tax=Petrolisthes manimaculis TaxID=1843537 RepID=A0AAE1TWI0_9EUCA|nr:hypothetical protein Pmani_027629 [Petrolisthes manimaculis]
MVLRYLLNKILNNPEVINRLAESYPIRRAAQITAYAIQRGKSATKDAIDSEVNKRVGRFRTSLYHDIKEGFKKLEEEKGNKQK